MLQNLQIRCPLDRNVNLYAFYAYFLSLSYSFPPFYREDILGVLSYKHAPNTCEVRWKYLACQIFCRALARACSNVLMHDRDVHLLTLCGTRPRILSLDPMRSAVSGCDLIILAFATLCELSLRCSHPQKDSKLRYNFVILSSKLHSHGAL